MEFGEQPVVLEMVDGKKMIRDPLRKRLLVWTPEEEVRQTMVWILVVNMNYPRSLIALERGLTIHGMKKRFDILVFDRAGSPFMAVECKAPHIPLTQSVAQQLATYNLELKARYLVITNGKQIMTFHVDHKTSAISAIKELPGPELLD